MTGATRAAARLFWIGALMLELAGSAHAAPPIAQEPCSQPSGDRQGDGCIAAHGSLVGRLAHSDGTCDGWMCCPVSPDGRTYDCASRVNRAGEAGAGSAWPLTGGARNTPLDTHAGRSQRNSGQVDPFTVSKATQGGAS